MAAEREFRRELLHPDRIGHAVAVAWPVACELVALAGPDAFENDSVLDELVAETGVCRDAARVLRSAACRAFPAVSETAGLVGAPGGV